MSDERWIQQAMKRLSSGRETRAEAVSNEVLARFIEGKLTEEEERWVLSALASDRSLQDLILELRGGAGLPGFDEGAPEVPREWSLKAVGLGAGASGARGLVCPHCHKAIEAPAAGALGKRRAAAWAWLGACVVCFVVSLAVPRYFVQWVALAVLCGIKWAIDARTVRSQVLIFKALREESGGPGSFESGRLQKHSAHL
ncbi:MAG: hypothetical protein MOGMAGMI_01080 [Candidatus Omnitrophica bacterium]|nr:hypothetical protein [Candidatus Omnitrophota bacterium]